jgi:hypothetical protein
VKSKGRATVQAGGLRHPRKQWQTIKEMGFSYYFLIVADFSGFI